MDGLNASLGRDTLPLALLLSARKLRSHEVNVALLSS